MTHYGVYEFFVMPFGLKNTPTKFSNLMNHILYDFFDDFIIIYLDDIIIYSRDLDEHLRNFELVLKRFQMHKLYVKMEKCEFARLLSHVPWLFC